MDSPTLNFSKKHSSEFFEQVAALFKKNLIIYWRNKGALVKELLLPMITSLSIYAAQFEDELFVPVEILFPISLLGHVRSFMVDVVHEKSEKYKEYLKINGVSSYAYLTSMLLFGYFKCLILTLVTCSGFFFTSSTDSAIGNGLVAVLYLMTAIACTHFALLFTAFFSSKQLCSDIGGFAFATLSFLFLIVMESTPKNKQLYYISLAFPQNALGYALFSDVAPEIPIDFLTLSSWTTLDGIVYLALFFYLDQVLPDAFGVRRSWLFCFGKCLKRKRDNEDGLLLQERSSLMTEFTSGEEAFQPKETGYSIEIDPDREEDGSSALYHEKFENSMNLKRTVFLENVSKSFGSDKVIDNLSLMAYERQVFCLLGHNGAGKTTTINLLTGILNYDSGEIFYRGKSFHNNMSSVRKIIGLCNQQDILYPDLTVEEHMELMGKIRGKSGVELYAEIQETMAKVGLTSERKKPAKTLSGGNRRKLSLGLAVLGGVRIVFLDEPTSGMDPNTRRFVWDLVKQLRDEGKTIVLTTHHLDEADELSDRLGVMSKGRLFAIGAPEFIKKKFGVGYHLEVTPNYDKNCTQEQFEDLKPEILEIVKKYIESARPDEQVGIGVIRFLLPFAFQHLFPPLFAELEKFENVKLNLRMNSLEDAFINIGLQDELLFQGGFQTEVAQANINIEPPRVVKTHIPKYDFWQQIEAMFQRKFCYTIRNYKNIVLIILPILFVILGTMMTVNNLRPLSDNPEVSPDESADPETYQPHIDEEVVEALVLVLFLFMVNFAYSLNATIYCVFPVYEREHNITYMLRVTGCQDKPYWIGTFLFDFLAIQVVNIVLVGLVFIFQIDALKENVFTFSLTLVSYSGALVASSYFWGYAFQSSNTVFKSYAAFYLFVVYTLPSILLVLAKQFGMSELIQTLLTVLVFHCCPNFAFNDSIRVSLKQESVFLTSQAQCVLWLIWLTIFYLGTTLFIHKQKAKVNVTATRAIQDINIDVGAGVDYSEMMAEASRVESPDNRDPVKIMHLSKVYSNGFRAVRDLSFGTQKGEIFGLLGPNGAGKSTTFGIATAMISRSGGNVQLNGQSIDGNLDDVFRDMSVCPQFDALWDELRVDEHLYLYAKVKGIENYDQQETVDYLLEALKLKDHRRKRAKELSGGSKRKLSTAMALIGSPYLKFLDEPSTGIDPMAKRFLWSCLKNFAAIRGGSTILTTHSMEEAEALCHRIGIIVNGGFVCVGPLQYLKDKYGSGYKVTVVRSPNVGDLSEYLNTIFPEAKKIQDAATTTETYHMASQSFKFSKALRELEELKNAKLIKDFSIYNTTLEQVFINFSRHQIEPVTGISGW